MNTKSFKAVLMSARPATLTAALAPVLVGWFIAVKLAPEKINFKYLPFLFLVTLGIQIATNLFNDYLDFFKGADKEDRLGPTRVTAAGLMPPHLVKKWALFFCFVAFCAGIPLVLRGGPWFLFLGLICLSLTYLYTGTKFSLAYTGLADIFVILFFGGLAVWGTCYLLTLEHHGWALLAGLQLGALCNILLLINNMRDEIQDRNNSKKTLVVRWGRKFALTEYLALVFFAFGGLVFWDFVQPQWIFLLAQAPLFMVSLFLWNWVRRHPPSIMYNKVLKLSSMVYLAFAVICCVGLKYL